MNKGQMISKISGETKVAKAVANRVLDSFINQTMSAVKKGDKVVLVGFGTFQQSKRSARKGINPQTMKVIPIPARKVVKFKVGKDFAAKLRK